MQATEGARFCASCGGALQPGATPPSSVTEQAAKIVVDQHNAARRAQMISALVVLGTLGYCTYIKCPMLPWVDTDAAERDPAQQKAQDAEKVDRDARRAKIVAAVCTPEIEQVGLPVVHRFVENEETDGMAVVYVKPEVWAALSIDAKTVFAGWAALCKRKKDKLSIEDGRSGETLKLWSLDSGFL